MTDLKELIEQEIDQYLEWPTTDKSHVTTVSAKLFAEHMARLYADHIPEAGKVVSDQLRGGTKKIGRPQIREAFLRNGARIEPDRDDLPDWVYEAAFELLDSAIQQAGPAIQYVAPAVQGEPGAWSGWGCQYPGKMPRLYGDRRIAELNCDAENGDQILYFNAAPQPAEQQSCPVCKGCGLNPLTEVPVACANCHGVAPAEQQPACASQSVKSDSQAALSAESERQAPDVAGLVDALEWIRKAINCTPENDKHQSGAWISTSHPRIKQIDALLANHRKGGDV